MYSTRIRFRYFIKPMGSTLHCLRVSESDPRISELVKTYNPIGWNTPIAYTFKPTPEQEAFEIKMSCRGWDKTVVIEDPAELK